MSTKIVCNLQDGSIQEVSLSAAELAELEERKAVAAAQFQPTPPPTKEELLAQLQALQAQIQALG